MFNRLIIAVLTLGLLLTCSSVIAGSDNDVTPIDGISPIIRINPDAPKYQDLKVQQQQENLDRPSANLHVVENPAVILPPTYFCQNLSYYGSTAYFWYLPDEGYPLDEYAMLTSPEPGYVCSVHTVWVLLYGGPHIGLPGAKATLRDASYNLIDEVELTPAEVDAIGYGWAAFDFSTANGGSAYTFTDGEEFFIGIQCVTDLGDDTLFVLSDDGSSATGRMRMHLGAPYNGWYSWTGDYAYIMDADVCCSKIPYSKCYTLDYDCNTYYAWPQPDPYNDDYFNQRFSVAGPETLIEIGVAFDNYFTVGTPDVDLFVWEDDGFGFPGAVVPGFPVTIPYASIAWYPAYTTYTLPTPVEFRNDFHVGWSTNDADPTWVLAGLSDDGSCGQLRSSETWNGLWGTMLADWGADVNFLIYAQMCKDEFAQCKWISDICNIAYYMGMPSVSRTAIYQKFTPMGLGCRLEQMDVVLYNVGDPNQYLLPTNANVFMSDGVDGKPGTLLNTTVITPAQYVYYPGYTSVDYTGLPSGGVIFDTPIWGGLEPLAGPGFGINVLTDDYTCNTRICCVEAYGTYEYTVDYYGVDMTVYFEAYVCCVPTPERPCLIAKGADDWTTYGKDFGRSHASLQSLGDDAQGELTKAWQYTATQFGNLNSAVIYNDTIVYYFLDHIVAIDLNNGGEIWKVTDPSGLIIGGGCYATPTIYNLDAYGENRTVVLTPGGDAKAFSALNLTDGSVFWTHNFLAHQNHFMTWGYSVVVECGGQPIVFYNDDNGDIYAREVLTGNLFAGWVPNPMNFGGFVLKGVSYGADVDLLYIGTDHNITDGNVTAVDPCTGAIVWDKLTSFGEQMSVLDPNSFADPPNQAEAHTGGISYDPPSEDFPDATLYFASEYSPSSIDYNSGGIVYSVDAATGALNWASLGIAADYCAVALDGAHIINYGWAPWVVGYGPQKGPTAYSKETGALLYTRTCRNPGQDIFMLADGMLSCEFEAPDWFVGGDREDFLNFYESDFPGRNRFHRRFAGGYEYAHHFAPSMIDGHLLFCYMNKLMCLTPQEPRPRLDIPLYIINSPVPFGLGDPYTVTFPDPATHPLGLPGAIGNLGGAPLTLDSLVLSDTTNGLIPDLSGDPGGAPMAIVDPGLADNMEKLASKFANDVDHFRVSISEELGIEDLVQGNRSSRKNAAFAIPSWVYTGTLTPGPGTVVPASGDYTDSSSNYVSITVDVNGTQVPRGYTGMYVFVYSDDPDYFLDSALIDAPKALTHAVPCIQLGIIGGCLYEDVVMDFGVGLVNYAHVWNSTKIADGDITSMEIGGDDGAYWQGSFVFATDGNYTPPGKPPLFSNKVALHARNWSSADPMSWQSILPDPDCVAGLCPPQHTTNALLGSMSDDGTAYRDVYGEVVTYAVIDSVQDCCEYDTLGACQNWNWTYAEPSEVGVQPPYEVAYTMGFKACVTVIGAYDEPRLADFYIEKFEFEGRYGAVDDVWMGVMNDYDINYNAGHTQQVAAYDADISTAWAYTCNNNSNGWGFVKIPFDACGSWDPIVNCKTLSADQSAWNDSMVWIDSAHYWMSQLTGASHQTGTDPAICASDPSDRDWFGTIGELDIPAGPDHVDIAVAIFGRPDLTTDADLASSYAQMSITADKWCGFWRGDVDDDMDIDILDVALIIDFHCNQGPGPYPFMYLGDVDCDDDVDFDDALYLLDYIMQVSPSPPPCGDWEL